MKQFLVSALIGVASVAVGQALSFGPYQILLLCAVAVAVQGTIVALSRSSNGINS